MYHFFGQSNIDLMHTPLSSYLSLILIKDIIINHIFNFFLKKIMKNIKNNSSRFQSAYKTLRFKSLNQTDAKSTICSIIFFLIFFFGVTIW